MKTGRENIDPAFIDRDYGLWSGQSRRQVEDRYGSLDRAPDDEIEAAALLEDRVVAALRAVVKRSRGLRVLVVAHDAVNRCLIRHFGWMLTDTPQPTGCWNRLVIHEQSWIWEVVGAVPGDRFEP